MANLYRDASRDFHVDSSDQTKCQPLIRQEDTGYEHDRLANGLKETTAVCNHIIFVLSFVYLLSIKEMGRTINFFYRLSWF